MGELQRDKIDESLEEVIKVGGVMCPFCNLIYYPMPPSNRICPRCNLTEEGESKEEYS